MDRTSILNAASFSLPWLDASPGCIIVAMPDWLSGVLGFAFIVGLFVAYAAEQRARRRAKNPPPAPDPAAEPVVSAQQATAPSDAAASVELARSASSPNWGAPIVFCLLLLFAATHRHSFWGYLWQTIFWVIVLVAAYSAFLPSEIAKEQARHPGMTKRDIFLITGVPYVVLPIIGWVLVIPLGWNWAVIVPALPWALLLVIGMIAVAFQKKR